MVSTDIRTRLLGAGLFLAGLIILANYLFYDEWIFSDWATVLIGLLFLIPAVIAIVSPKSMMENEPSWVLVIVVDVGSVLLSIGIVVG